MSVCRSCGAAIAWARLASGRAMPLDPNPDPAHGTVLVGKGAEARVLTENERTELAFRLGPDAPLYVSHFATCPDAAEHRRAS